MNYWYLQILRDHIIPQLRNELHRTEIIILMQGGAPPHIFRPGPKQFMMLFSKTISDSRMCSNEFKQELSEAQH